MKFSTTVFILFCVFNSAQSQDLLSTNIVEDTLFTSVGYKIVIGQDVKLGKGTTPYGDFKTITISSASIFASNNTREDAVGRKWNGHLFKVKRFRKEGNKKRGFTYYLILGGGNIANYECDIESAIACGEIVVPEEYRPKPKAMVVEVKQPVSIADELAKLKKLYSDSTLTKEEYEVQKKKLLEQ